MSKKWQNYLSQCGRRMKERLKTHGLLLLIVALGLWVRGWKLGEWPQGLNRDEAAIAYNAYLITQTGKDEWQRVYPVFFESFGDQKLPGYPYVVAFLFQWLPINDAVVRLPSCLAGVGLIVIAYFLVWTLGKAKKCRQHLTITASLTALLVALNPVFIWYSRGAWEANLALFWLMLAVLLIWRHYYYRRGWQVWSLLAVFVLLMLSFLTYNSPLLIATVALVFLPWWLWRAGKEFWGPLWVSVAVAVVTCFVLLIPVNRQKTGISIFTDATVHYQYLQYREHLPAWLLPVAGSRYVYWLGKLAETTGLSFSPRFWWHGGSHPWHQLSNFGVLHWSTGLWLYVTLVSLLIVTALSWRGQKFFSQKLVVSAKILSLVVICLVPSVITVDSPHVTRSLVFFYVLILLGGCWLLYVREIWHRRHYQWSQWLVIGLLFLTLGEAGWYLYSYKHYFLTHNLYQAGLADFLPTLTHEKPVLVWSPTEPSMRQYEYIIFAWELKLAPDLFWHTQIRENADTVGIKGISDLLDYHFADDGIQLPGNWQIIRYNTDKQQWERAHD